MRSRTQNVLLIALILIITLPLLLSIRQDTNLHVDERDHLDQITRFLKGEKTLNPLLTTIPGYHLILATLLKPFPNPALPLARTLTFIFSLLSILVFFLIVKKIDPTSLFTKTLQYAFFPVLFPFFFLLYTDVFSLLLVLAAFFFALRKSYNLTAFIGVASIAVRQNNILWLLFLFTFMFFQEYSTINKESIKNHLKKSWLFLLGFIAFAIFLFINQGIAIGDKTGHPGGIFFGNIYFLLFLFFFLLLPYNLANLKKIKEKIKEKPKIILLLLVILMFYLFTFKNTHPYNQEAYNFFLRNQILNFFTSSLFLKILFFLPIAGSMLSLWTTKLPSKACYLMYPTTILYLLPSWLIEQRYYLIPFALFLALKERKSSAIEYFTILAYIALSLYFFYGIRHLKFFL